MKVLELQNLKREEGQIFYIKKYNCEVLFEFPTSQEVIPTYFEIETNPFGQKMINITFLKPLNYPLLPVKKALLEFILTEEIEGRLPC